MPANIVKPFTSLDTLCPAQDINTNSVYKFSDPSSNDIDKDESIYADNGRGKVTRHSPTYSLELSSSSSKPNGRLFSLAVTIIAVVSHLNKFMWNENRDNIWLFIFYSLLSVVTSSYEQWFENIRQSSTEASVMRRELMETNERKLKVDEISADVEWKIVEKTVKRKKVKFESRSNKISWKYIYFSWH